MRPTRFARTILKIKDLHTLLENNNILIIGNRAAIVCLEKILIDFI